MSNKKGEIATILTLGSLVVLGAVSIISTIFMRNNSILKTKANEGCAQMANKSCVNYPLPPPIVVKGQNKIDKTGACNPACCECNEQCPSGQKCDIPNGYCKSGFSCNPATGKKLTCVSGQCVWQPCQGDDCNKNTCSSHSDCQTQPSSTTSPPTSGCFNIKAEFEVRPEGDKKAFYSWVTFNSNKGGDIKLEYNGIHVAGWNRFGGGTFTYSPQWTQPHTHDYESGIAAFSGKSHMPFTYRGMHSGCQPQDFTLSCAVGIDDQGNPYVQGDGCSCRNCNTNPPTPTQRPTPTPTPIPELGKEGGRCGNLYHEYRMWFGTCNDGLVCDPQNGICVKPSPTSSPRATNTPTPTPTRTSSLRATNTPTPTPTRTSSLRATNTPTPTPLPTPTPRCDFEDINYCIDYGQQNEWKNCKTGSPFPCCQRTSGEWVKLVETGTYPEECYYHNSEGTVLALKGVRTVKRENGKKDMNYSCKYSIESDGDYIKCNYNGWEGRWNPVCNQLCNFSQTYPVTVIIKSDYFSQYFQGVEIWDEFTIEVTYDFNMLGIPEVSEEIQPSGNNDGITKEDLTDIKKTFYVSADELIKYYDNKRFKPEIGSINIKIWRKKNNDDNDNFISVPPQYVRLNLNDLTFVIE